MSHNQHIQWTEEEWAKVASRAKALKEAKPDMSWQNIVVVCQDEIRPERRRFYFNKLSSLKPMFDILDLDDMGNAKPPPPPPEPPPLPEPLPEPVSAPAVPAAVQAQTPLSAVPVEALVAELMSRGATMKALADQAVAANAEVQAAIKHNNQVLEGYAARVDSVEKMIMEALEAIDAVNGLEARLDTRYKFVGDNYREIKDLNGKLLLAFAKVARDDPKMDGVMEVICDEADKAEARAASPLGKGEPLAHTPPKLAPIRFLLIGPFPKDITRIKERLPRTLNVDLIYGENNDSCKYPSNIHYCLVSGHPDALRRWQTALHTYGSDKAFRMENGSIGTFAHRIQTLCATNGHHTNGVSHLTDSHTDDTPIRPHS